MQAYTNRSVGGYTQKPPTATTPQHAATLRRSAIAPDVAAERGVWSVTRSDAKLDPFKAFQRSDGILFRVHPPDGSNGLYSLRHDRPRAFTDPETGTRRTAKYELPVGAKHRLDVHPRNHHRLAEPSIPLWVTEGIKKGDALCSLGLCAVALGGVWCFRKECLADWERIVLRDRTVIIVFDSDAETNPKVAMARDELARFLAGRGARVRILRVPCGPNGAKQGIDDYLGNGGDLFGLVVNNCEDWRPPATTGGDGAETCRQCAERRELEQAEATILASPRIKSHRKVPYLLWLRRLWSDRSRDRHPRAEAGKPEAWNDELPVTTEDGYHRLTTRGLKYWGEQVGYGAATLAGARDELIDLDILDVTHEEFELDSGYRTSRPLVRPKAAACLLDSVRNLARVAQPTDTWGGERENAGRKPKGWRCPDPDHAAVKTKRVCALCGADAVRVDVPESAPDIQLEYQDNDSSSDRPHSLSNQDEYQEPTGDEGGRCAAHGRLLNYWEFRSGRCSSCEQEQAEPELAL